MHVHRHEGSFWPMSTVRAFVSAAFNGTIFEEAAQAQQQGQGCPCFCRLYNGTPCGTPRSAFVEGCVGACTFDELLLPTFAAQSLGTSATPEWRSASPALVLHVEGVSLAALQREVATRGLLEDLAETFNKDGSGLAPRLLDDAQNEIVHEAPEV